MPDTPKFPDVTVNLDGIDGNAAVLIGATSKALRRGGATPEQISEFREDATSGDYDHVLTTIQEWADVQ